MLKKTNAVCGVGQFFCPDIRDDAEGKRSRRRRREADKETKRPRHEQTKRQTKTHLKIERMSEKKTATMARPMKLGT